ncbi:hypothetical protein REPUB_Repub13aG0083200 [Reevesia pubescens]
MANNNDSNNNDREELNPLLSKQVVEEDEKKKLNGKKPKQVTAEVAASLELVPKLGLGGPRMGYCWSTGVLSENLGADPSGIPPSLLVLVVTMSFAVATLKFVYLEAWPLVCLRCRVVKISFLNESSSQLNPKNHDLFYSQAADLSSSSTAATCGSTDAMGFPSYWGSYFHKKSSTVSDILGADNPASGRVWVETLLVFCQRVL